MHEEIPSVRAFNPDLPQSVENIVIRSTAKLKEDRYESADEMYNDLVTCLDLSRAREQKLVVASKVKQQQEEKAVEHKVKVKVRKDRPTAGNFLAAGKHVLRLAGSRERFRLDRSHRSYGQPGLVF